jgi:transposase
MTRIGKGKVMQDTVGIDVSKATLDAYWLSGRQHQVFSNDPAGLKRLLRWICKAKATLTVFEATGVYDRLLQAQLAAHGMPFSRVNPKQARRFAEGIGQLAKTDKVDAVLLARMGSLLDLEAEQPRAHSSNVLKDLATARQALIRDRTAAKARAQTADIPLLKTQFSRRLKQIEHDLAQVEAAILSVIAQDEALSESAEILTSIPGIATVTACAMLTEMPELGKLSGKQAASLAGLAPMSRQSGKWQGREHIRGGRAEMRRSLYLPTVVATRFNPAMKEKYNQLVASGKSKKLAITAIMRKLLVMANPLLRDRRKWAKIHP